MAHARYLQDGHPAFLGCGGPAVDAPSVARRGRCGAERKRVAGVGRACYGRRASRPSGRGGFHAWPIPGRPSQQGVRCQVQVLVRDNNVDQALKALKKKMQREGVFREMKLRRHYEKPSERRAREAAEAVRRARKLERKRLEREGF